jgi:hypothetical protein
MLNNKNNYRKGHGYPYTTKSIVTIAMLMLILTTEMFSSMFVDVHLQKELDAACAGTLQGGYFSFENQRRNQ